MTPVRDGRARQPRQCLLRHAHIAQLLRDADWAGMAHSLEIRMPLVDAALLARLAPAIAELNLGEGKRALAHAPSLPLPDRLVARAKTCFGVPMGAWLDAEAARSGSGQDTAEPKGLVSRRWSRVVLAAAAEDAVASKAA